MEKITFEVYKKAILEKYSEEKKGDFNRFFDNPTPAKIKKASRQILYSRKQNQNDLRILSDFIDVSRDTDFSSLFKKIEAEKFKSVQKFLLDKTKDPEEYLIEFVAWLVDFQPRPYAEFRKNNGDVLVISSKKDQIKSEEGNSEEKKPEKIESPPETIPPSNIIKTNNTYRNMILSFSLVVVIGLILYLAFDWQQKDCMIWKEDHYEKITCRENSLNISYNQNVIENFKKAKIDTIETFFKQGDTLYWYYITDGEIELFTAKGNHPISGKRLKPISERIVRKYVDNEDL